MQPAANAKLLVLLLGSIGDVIRALPVPTAIKVARPDVRIYWAVETKSLAVVKSAKNLDGIIHFEREQGGTAFWQFLRAIKSENFDIVLDMQRHLKSGVVSRYAGAKRRIGFHRKNTKEFNWLFNNEQIEYVDARVSKLQNYLGFLNALSIPQPPALDFGLNSASCYPGLPERYIAFVLGSSWNSKDWFLSGYQGLLALLLKESDLGVVLIGDRSKESDAALLADLHDSKRVVNLVGKTKLDDLIPILNGALAAVGPDSGPGHLSAAVRTPYVTLFGPTDPSRVVPYGCEELAVQARIGCAPCWRRECPGLGKLCMRMITPEEVWQKIKKSCAYP